MFWMLIEVNLIIFLMVIYYLRKFYFKEERFGVRIYYFILQSLGRLIFLLRINSKDLGFLLGDWIFIFSIFLKIGLFPFFFWVYKLGECSGYIITFFILTFQKIPLFIILFFNFRNNILFLIFFSFIFGSFMIYFSFNYLFLFISSSISSSFWVYLIFLDNFYLFSIFFLIYTFSLFLFFFFLESRNFSLLSYGEFLLLTVIFIFLVGLPPMRLFFFKFNISFFFGLGLGSLELLLFWFLRLVSLFGYTKFFFSYFVMNEILYLKNEFWISKISFFYFNLIFFLCFLIWKSKLYKLLSSYLK